jgi:hypothetical protein
MGSRSRMRWLSVVTFALLLGLNLPPTAAAGPAWLEPRALNIAHIAGQVPDEVLRDNILAYSGIGGIARFISSRVEGSVVQITARMDTFHWPGDITAMTLLGQRAFLDHMGSVCPAGWVRIYESNGADITNLAWEISYADAALALPIAPPTGDRFPNRSISSLSYGQWGLVLPANYGGEVYLRGNHPVVTAVFTLPIGRRPVVAWLGTQQEDYQTFLGPYTPGDAGILQGLMRQLKKRFPGLRHPSLYLHPPSGTNYVMLTYPPMPFNIYDYSAENKDRPIASTTRFARIVKPEWGRMLSANLTHGGAFPLLASWQDVDQVCPGYPKRSCGPYLSLMPSIDSITPPESLVPPGVAYDSCMSAGNCSTALLDRIYHAVMQIKIIYLKVEPQSGEGLQAIPLKMASLSWNPSVGVAAAGGRDAVDGTASAGPAPLSLSGPHKLLLPFVAQHPLPPLPTIAVHPAGYFDVGSGAMVGYEP